MITVSDAWKDIQQRFLLPEGHIEIKCALTEAGLQESASITGAYEAAFSNTTEALNTDSDSVGIKYATNELNLWALDASCMIMPDEAPFTGNGYVSNIEATGNVTIALPAVHTGQIPGVTITWGDAYGEYPPVFTVTAKNGNTTVAETTVTDNTKSVCIIDMELTGYDSITVTIHNWCLPNRRPRIEKVVLGHMLTLTKKNILSYSHEQNGDLLMGELPKNSIDFSLDNIDGRWNPNNPTGIERYLSERQRLTVRYGFTIDNKVEWIKAGTFYLSEWRAPANGLEAIFSARDIFEYLMNEPYTGVTTGSWLELVEAAFSAAGLPAGFEYVLDTEALSAGTAAIESGREYSCAEIIQLCANAASLVVYQDRSGVLHIENYAGTLSEYMITSALSYSHPEVELSKPLKAVSITGSMTGTVTYGSTGETQTVDNPFIGDVDAIAKLAEWVKYVLASRKTVNGEYRADPRLDLFDVVTVESKYGRIAPVAITNIKYTFSGSFRANYTGRVLEGERTA